ncbi:hypothetical protein GGR44_001788 [Sphingobium fontiphilum]|uniref:Uncharacterized protein n=1 Tax=Sphingobium fontiphilum TaxID=944425 RepID=A0A7W6GQK1_9SPHN|nr:hypothetical protein [Sphingobium fontiphilum]MBB3982129.1 hypothetical protein [Sphingobium fontiphilum]
MSLLLAASLVSCADASISRREVIARQIEKVVVLPEGAGRLEEYGRNYAFASDKQVLAVYLMPLPSSADDDGCEIMLDNLSSRPCSESEISDISGIEGAASSALARAGEVRWFKAEGELPFILDGGCTQVTLRYDLVAQRVTTIYCNGDA